MSMKNEKVPQKIAGLLAILVLVMILSAKEFFTVYVQGFADQIGVSLGDAWVIIFVVAAFLLVLITWFFTSIRIEKK